MTYNNSLNRIDGYCYDGAGQLLDQGGCVPSGGKNQNFYDGWGNLASGTFNSSNLVSYTIDGEHRRVATFQGSLQHTYLYGADGLPIAETDEAGNWFQTDVYLGGTLLAEYSGNDTIFQQGDQVGTIRMQINSAGSVIASCTNQPFGDFLACNGSQNPSGYHFTGKQHDPETGNDYFGARFYSSSMGRFMSPDYSDDGDGPQAVPYFNPSNPQSLNLYGYASNNPLSNTDDDGHDYYLQGGSQCDQNGIQCDQQRFLLSADGSRQVVTDQALANGTYGASAGANGGINITTGQGTFAGQFFDASPNAVSATVYGDPPISGFSQDFIRQTNAYNQTAMPMLYAGAANAAVALGVMGAAELSIGGEMTTLGDLSSDLTEHAPKRLADHGITADQARAAIEAAKISGDVVPAMGRYGPQLRYTANGIRVIVATTGRNAGKIITAFWK